MLNLNSNQIKEIRQAILDGLFQCRSFCLDDPEDLYKTSAALSAALNAANKGEEVEEAVHKAIFAAEQRLDQLDEHDYDNPETCLCDDCEGQSDDDDEVSDQDAMAFVSESYDEEREYE